MKAVLTEAVGTAVLLMAIVGSGIAAVEPTDDVGLQLVFNAIATVAVLGVLVAVALLISGGSFNPAVTLAESPARTSLVHRRSTRRCDARTGSRTRRQGGLMTDRPTVLFVCVHNAGRSQIAAGFLTSLSGGAVEVLSAGSDPADGVNPVAIAAMAEVGIDIAGEKPKILTDQAVQGTDVVVTMGCGDACPFYPGKRYEDWELDDPAGRSIEEVRPIRDEIRARVEVLLASLPTGSGRLQ